MNDIRKSDYASEYEFKRRDGPKTFKADIKGISYRSEKKEDWNAVYQPKPSKHRKTLDCHRKNQEGYDSDGINKSSAGTYKAVGSKKVFTRHDKALGNSNDNGITENANNYVDYEIEGSFYIDHEEKASGSQQNSNRIIRKRSISKGNRKERISKERRKNKNTGGNKKERPKLSVKKNDNKFKKQTGIKKIRKKFSRPVSASMSSIKEYAAGYSDNASGSSSYDMARDTFSSSKRKTDELMELLKKTVMLVKAVVTSALLPLLAILALIFLIVSTIMSLVGADMQEGSQESLNKENETYPESVIEWEPEVRARLVYYYDEDREYDSRVFTDAILVLIWMESAGSSEASGGDIMQCAESGNMTNNLPDDWDRLTTEERSIDGGIRMFLYLLESWGVTSPDDHKGLQVIAQAYNYGPGFLNYMRENGNDEWSEDISRSYSAKQRRENGFLIYGNPIYGKTWLERYNTVFGNSELLWPVPEIDKGSSITDYFGPRVAPTAGASTYHNGIDIGARQGADVIAAADGKVTAATYSSVRGNYIVIEHRDGKETWYQHLSERIVVLGQTVNAGELIGKVGTTGISTGPHLHYEVHIDGEPVDPLKFYK